MKRFEVTMMCTACKWKIMDELQKQGYQDFDIDMDTSVLTFSENVNSFGVVKIVNRIGYKIEPLEEIEDISDEEQALIEDAIRNGYPL